MAIITLSVATVIAATPPVNVCCGGASKAIVGDTKPLPPASTVTDITLCPEPICAVAAPLPVPEIVTSGT